MFSLRMFSLKNDVVTNVMISNAAEKASKRKRKDLYDGIDPDYYGYRDEDDGKLVPIEERAEKKGLCFIYYYYYHYYYYYYYY